MQVVGPTTWFRRSPSIDAAGVHRLGAAPWAVRANPSMDRISGGLVPEKYQQRRSGQPTGLDFQPGATLRVSPYSRDMANLGAGSRQWSVRCPPYAGCSRWVLALRSLRSLSLDPGRGASLA